jgi:hypothetical protein
VVNVSLEEAILVIGTILAGYGTYRLLATLQINIELVT